MGTYFKNNIWNRYVKVPWRLIRKMGLLDAMSANDIRECNICGYHGCFLPRGNGFLQCPNCKSGNRHRLIIWFLRTHMPQFFSEPMRVLHFAPEQSLGSLFRNLSNLTYETADLGAKGVTHHFDLQKEHRGEDVYDLIMANHIMEHIPDDRAAIQNILHMLKPGGLAIITVPTRTDSEETDDDPTVIDPEQRQRRFGASNHLRFYGRDLVKKLCEEGLSASIYEPPEGDLADRYAMNDELIFLGVKPNLTTSSAK